MCKGTMVNILSHGGFFKESVQFCPKQNKGDFGFQFL